MGKRLVLDCYRLPACYRFATSSLARKNGNELIKQNLFDQIIVLEGPALRLGPFDRLINEVDEVFLCQRQVSGRTKPRLRVTGRQLNVEDNEPSADSMKVRSVGRAQASLLGPFCRP
jgi:hypothetical protein